MESESDYIRNWHRARLSATKIADGTKSFIPTQPIADKRCCIGNRAAFICMALTHENIDADADVEKEEEDRDTKMMTTPTTTIR